MNTNDINTALRVTLCAEVLLMLLEDVENTNFFRGAVKAYTNNAIKHFGAISRTFTDNVDKDEANQYGLITGEIYRKFKEIEIELTKTETNENKRN
jgi:hypothetical protein